MSLDAAEHTAV